ncbi:transcription factor bHLH154 [Musa acuminata AAA Group]|uniref:transcription factor bHLH154 n=1 Tax=Musa acuminata AAA Group TaxID=214697 RepID=UPI0031D95A97
MEEESFMDVLRTGEEEDYLLSRYSSLSPTGMLCFGEEEDAVSALRRAPRKANDSSPPPTTIDISKSPIKRVGSSCGGRGRRRRSGVTASATPATITARKEKVGERIMALQRLVSPFGKSDTASVLHEALEYIRFLHEQVQVLSSPYLRSLPSSADLHDGRGSADLRSRGLCLVPVACTEDVTRSNGADLWSPATGSGSRGSSSSSSKH